MPLDTLDDLLAAFPDRGEHPAMLAPAANGGFAATSYGRLHDEVVRLARGLAGTCGADACILLWAPNSTAWITAYLGIITAGAMVVPLDDQADAEGLAAVLAQNAPAAVLSVSAHCDDLRRAGIPAQGIFLLDTADDARSWRGLLRDSGATPTRVGAATRIAALLYTSGTTGTPKGVPLTHGNICSNVRGILAAGVVQDTDRVLLPLPLHHAYAATVGMLTPLARGATVVLPAGVAGPELAAAASGAQATVLVGVPRLYEALLESIAAAVAARGAAVRVGFRMLLRVAGALRRATGINAGRLAFGSVHRRVGAALSTLASGGALLDPAAARRLEAIGWCVLTGYGLTETSPVVTFNAPRGRRLDTQGRALAGVELRIQAGNGPGEIEVRGPGVFAGYWRDPAATERAFAPGGWFRTGDSGYIDGDGFLHVLGRRSDVIVLPDGKKISPEGLEHRYEQSPYIREVALLAPHGELLALVVPDEDAVRARGTMSQQNLLRDELDSVNVTLPSWQRLRGYRVVRQDLPRTRLGKLRRHLLPALYAAAGPGAAPKKAPAAAGAADRHLLQSERVRPVWHWLTARYPGVTPDSSPQLDLGIDSLGWVALTAELEDRFGLVLGSEQLRRVLTVRDLLVAVDRSDAGTGAAAPLAAASAARYLDEPGPGGSLLGALIMGSVRLLMYGPYRLRVTGRENLPTRGAFVLAPNHTSYLDPLAVAAALPRALRRRTCWAGWAGKTHSSAPVRAASRALRVFPVDADQDSGQSIRLGVQALAAGDVLVWFPEGRRSRDGRLQPFRPGLGRVLERLPVPVVPVRIDGAFAAWPPGRAWPRLNRLAVRFAPARSPAWMNERGRGADAFARISDVIARDIADLAPDCARHAGE